MRAVAAALLLHSAAAAAGAPKNPMTSGKQMPGPASTDPETLASWHADMQTWREQYKKSTKYSGAIYEDPQLKWTQTSYMQPQMHPCEPLSPLCFCSGRLAPLTPPHARRRPLLLRSRRAQVHGAEVAGRRQRALRRRRQHPHVADVHEHRHGRPLPVRREPRALLPLSSQKFSTGAACTVQLFEAMPGGLPGVRAAVDELHAAGVKVLIPYNPWDTGTLRCGAGGTCGGSENRTNATAVCKASVCKDRNSCALCDARIITGLIKEMNADGFNGGAPDPPDPPPSPSR